MAISVSLALACGSCSSAGTVRAVDGTVRTVDLQRLLVGYVNRMPGRGSDAMTIPTPTERRRFVAAIVALRDGHSGAARRLISGTDYVLSKIEDSATNRYDWVLAEPQPGRNPTVDHHGPTRFRGWGTYVVADHPAHSLVIEVPHPLFDVNTPQAGVEAFRHGNAVALLMAGTHRYADPNGVSDVAHNSRTMFAWVNRALTRPGYAVLQPHGFAATASRDENQVVLSSGSHIETGPVAVAARALRTAGFDVCVYRSASCNDLGATTNVQGIWSRRIGAQFMHVEMSRSVRDDPVERKKVMDITVDALLHR